MIPKRLPMLIGNGFSYFEPQITLSATIIFVRSWVDFRWNIFAKKSAEKMLQSAQANKNHPE